MGIEHDRSDCDRLIVCDWISCVRLCFERRRIASGWCLIYVLNSDAVVCCEEEIVNIIYLQNLRSLEFHV